MNKAIFLLPILVLIANAPSAFASSESDYQKGLDVGTQMAQKAIPVCGSNSACHSDFSPSDCQDSVGNNVGDPVAYCQGFIK